MLMDGDIHVYAVGHGKDGDGHCQPKNAESSSEERAEMVREKADARASHPTANLVMFLSQNGYGCIYNKCICNCMRFRSTNFRF